MTDSMQKVVQEYEYDSFGNLHDLKNAIKQPYTFTGREYDRETELYYYRARYYDAEVGRFTSFDPILHPVNEYGKMVRRKSSSINPFIYVKARPTMLVDPFGLASTNYYFYASGVWNQDTTFEADLGQGVTIDVKNVNILGTTISIDSNRGQSQQLILLPQQSYQFKFSVLSCEPVYWKFDVSTQSDAFIINYEIKSTWVPGMPINQ